MGRFGNRKSSPASCIPSVYTEGGPLPLGRLNDGKSMTWREGPATSGKTKDLGVKILKVEHLFGLASFLAFSSTSIVTNREGPTRYFRGIYFSPRIRELRRFSRFAALDRFVESAGIPRCARHERSLLARGGWELLQRRQMQIPRGLTSARDDKRNTKARDDKQKTTDPRWRAVQRVRCAGQQSSACWCLEF